jgi:hypothetical protein
MQPVAAQTFIIEKFAAEVSPMYTYHNVHHVRAVFHHAALIAERKDRQPRYANIINSGCLS